MTEAPPPPGDEGSTPPPGYQGPPPGDEGSTPPPGYQAPPPGYGPPPGYQVPPPDYGPPAGYGHPPAMLSPQDERTWGMLAHLSALIALVIGLSFVGPLVVLLVQGPKSPYVRAQAVESLNFQITVLLAALVSSLLILVLIGLILLPVVIIGWLVLTIRASVAANRGEAYRYPLNLRLVT